MEIKVKFNLHDLAIAALRGGDEEEKAYDTASLEHDYIYASLFIHADILYLVEGWGIASRHG